MLQLEGCRSTSRCLLKIKIKRLILILAFKINLFSIQCFLDQYELGACRTSVEFARGACPIRSFKVYQGSIRVCSVEPGKAFQTSSMESIITAKLCKPQSWSYNMGGNDSSTVWSIQRVDKYLEFI